MRGRGLADTSVFIARESGRAIKAVALPDEIGVSVITIGELRAGVLAAIDVDTRDRRLATLTQAQALEPILIDGRVADYWGRLRLLLRDTGQRMPVNDSWICATAMSHGLALITQDEDYIELPELDVIKV